MGTSLIIGMVSFRTLKKAYMYISFMQESNCGDARTIYAWVTTDMVEVAEHRNITG
jgi:hypothetical protein